jgi:hypothetical protein
VGGGWLYVSVAVSEDRAGSLGLGPTSAVLGNSSDAKRKRHAIVELFLFSRPGARQWPMSVGFATLKQAGAGT